MNITKISIERPTLLAVFLILCLIAGISSYFRLNYELVPRFSPPVITVVTIFGGASAEEVDEKVTRHIEDAMSSLSDIDVINSVSRPNFSLVRLEMKQGTDLEATLNKAASKIRTLVSKLPEGADYPTLSRFDFDDLPAIRLAVFSNLDNTALSEITRQDIIPKLNQINGVGEIRLSGDTEKEIKIDVDPNRLYALNLSILQILKAIGGNNLSIPGGNITSGSEQLAVDLNAKYSNINQIKNTPIFKNEKYGLNFRLVDVAGVKKTDSKPVVISRFNGKPALGIEIIKQSGANAVEVSKQVQKAMAELEDQFHFIELKFEVAQDNSEFTMEAANSVLWDLSLATFLVGMVMLLFLHSYRNALIVFVSIPTSIITTFAVMQVMGYSLNLLSLLGLSLAIGILVDDSIVVIENIHRHLEMKKSPWKAAYEGRMEIGFAAISITLIDVVVFLPIVFTQGMVSDLLRQFSVVIIASTLMSLLISFTLVPFLASRFGKYAQPLKKSKTPKILQWSENLLDGLAESVIRSLTSAFRHQKLTLTIVFLLFIASIALIPLGFIGIEFTKGGDRSEFIMELKAKNGSTLEKTDKICQMAEKTLLNHEMVESVFVTVGTTSSGRITSNTSNLAEVYVKVIDKNERDESSSQLARKLKYLLEESIPGIEVSPTEVNLIGLRDDDAVQLTLMSEDEDDLRKNALAIHSVLEELPGTIETKNDMESAQDEIVIEPIPTRLEMLDIDPSIAGISLRTALNGHRDFNFYEKDEILPIDISVQDNALKQVKDLERLSILNNKGKLYTFGDFANVSQKAVTNNYQRTNRRKSVTIKSQVIGKPAGTVGSELNTMIGKAGLPANIQVLWGGATKRTQEGLQSMGTAFAISILLVYLILVALYDSFYYPLVVLFTIPLAIIGALVTLAVTNEALSIFSVMGLIMLVGLVGKNAILVVDFANNLRKKGVEIKDALLRATRLRFRPILMTNLTMVIGLMPIALATGAGSEWKNGLAWVLIGGLSSSMVLTLIVVPLVYYNLDVFRNKLTHRTKSKIIETFDQN